MSNFNKVKQIINKLGYYFSDCNIEDIYKDVNQKYNLIDDNEYRYYCCLKHLLKNKLPSIVGNGNPYSIENIKNWIRINQKHYNLLSDTFQNSHTYLDLKCTDCNIIFQRTWNDLKNGVGCRKCRYNNQRILQMRPKNENSKPLSYYSDICLDWSTENERPYTDYSSGSGFKAVWECHECGYKWSTSIAHRTLNSSGCPKCANKMSKAEKYIYNYLSNKGIIFNKEYTFHDCRDINPLPFDFYIPSYNICIEYDGLQHFQPVRFSKDMSIIDAKNKLIITQKHDKIKNEYCIKNNIRLFRISYKDNITKILDDIFQSVA